MRYIKKFLRIVFLLNLFFISANAQHDTLHIQAKDPVIVTQNNNPNPEDDEFNVMLFSIAVIFVGIMIGAAIIGALAATLFVLLLFALVSAGILSVSVFAGFYKKSIAHGFKTFVMIICILAGIILGPASLLIISKIANFHLTNKMSLLIGSLAGFLGGILMGLITFKILQLLFNYFKQKFRLN